MARCESHLAAVSAHAKGERDTRLENERLRREMNQLAERYRALQVKFSQRDHGTGPPGEVEGRPNDDPRRGQPRSQSRLDPDPLRSIDVNRHEPIGQTARSTSNAVVNKRKYAASIISASLSLSSSISSSAPSSPISDVDHEANDPGERPVLAPTWGRKIAKRPRLDSALSGGGDVTASLRQTLVPPPVFRRRPATPFNRSRGETSAVAGDQGEGLERAEGSGNDEIETGRSSPASSDLLMSDDSLNLPVSRLR